MRRGALQLDRKDATQGQALHCWLNQTLLSYRNRILSVGQAVAGRWAILQVSAVTSTVNVFIAANALVHNFTLVTRNVRHFDRDGVRLLNPFT